MSLEVEAEGLARKRWGEECLQTRTPKAVRDRKGGVIRKLMGL